MAFDGQWKQDTTFWSKIKCLYPLPRHLLVILPKDLMDKYFKVAKWSNRLSPIDFQWVIMWCKIIWIRFQIKNWDFLNTDPSDTAKLSDILAFIFTSIHYSILFYSLFLWDSLLILALNLYLLHLQKRTGDWNSNTTAFGTLSPSLVLQLQDILANTDIQNSGSLLCIHQHVCGTNSGMENTTLWSCNLPEHCSVFFLSS